MSRHGRPMPGLDELFQMLEREAHNPKYAEGEPEQRKASDEMWRAIVFQKDTMILDHSQYEYGRVFRFVMGMLAELHNNNVDDYRVTIQNQKGDLYFFAIGPKTQVVNYKKSEVK